MGFGKRIKNGMTSVGYWNKVDYIEGKTCKKKDITTYNPNVNLCAKKVDYKKYEIYPKENKDKI